MLFGLLLLAGGCTQESNDDDGQGDSQEPSLPDDEQPVEGPDTTPDTGEFSLEPAAGTIVLTEGDDQGMTVEISLLRDNDFDGEVTLGVETADAALVDDLSARFSPATLSGSRDTSEIDAGSRHRHTIPRQAEDIEIAVTATSGNASASTAVTLDITPVDAPDVYLLIGQSNMVGFSGDKHTSVRRWTAGCAEPAHPAASGQPERR